MGTSLGHAMAAAWDRRAAEEAARYAITPGENRRVLGEMSPCNFLGRALKVVCPLSESQAEVHGLRMGKLDVSMTARYGKLSWELRYIDPDRGTSFRIGGRASYEAGGLSPAQCMAEAEMALAACKLAVSNAEVE